MIKLKRKIYHESVESLKWMYDNVEKQGTSAFIREAVRREIVRQKKLKKPTK